MCLKRHLTGILHDNLPYSHPQKARAQVTRPPQRHVSERESRGSSDDDNDDDNDDDDLRSEDRDTDMLANAPLWSLGQSGVLIIHAGCKTYFPFGS